MTTKDPELRAHQEWLGYVQPVGLVVSAHALHRAQAFVAKGILPEHGRFLALVKEVPVAGKDEPLRAITDLEALATSVFGWEGRDLVGALGGEPIPDALKVPLSEYGETLVPTYAVADPEPQGEGAARWQMLIQKLELAKPLDEPLTKDDLRWQASPQARLERLLREAGVPAGLLTNGTEFRLVYAPRGESSGHATFRVDQMCEIAGRPIFAALQMLLGAERLFTLPRKQRLPYILSESRKYQNEVSTALAEQVLHALYEMLRGFQRANDESRGELLRDVLREDPNHVYSGLLTVLLRLIFVLYAEERGLLSSDPVYVNHYSVLGLFERLRADNDRNQDTMDHRYGAWAQLLTLFRLIHDGGSHGSLRLPPRHGHLFNPDRFNFLEGRPWRIGRVMGDRVEPPGISDGVIHRVLSKLLLLDGERISYRSLDVEQIGSVYEVMMGFTLDTASGPSIAIKPKKTLGAPSMVNLEELLAVAAKERAKWLRKRTDQEFSGEASASLIKAATLEDLTAALAKRVAREASPTPLPKGSMILLSSEARRRSGSNYTPRSLTEPIVRKTLEPILRGLGERPKPSQILALKVCDPAMGSGAFLVEACRQLGDELVKAWHEHAQLPKIPLDEDEVLHARRLVAQRCLYGVDKNPIAADLAKLSLWLVTLAREHAFTFLDHSLRCGDSLVGFTRKQIEGFHWQPAKQLELVRTTIVSRLTEAMELRARIQEGGDDLDYDARRLLLEDADEALDDVRLIGDLVTCAFFEAESSRQREAVRVDLAGRIGTLLNTRDNFNELRTRAEVLHGGETRVAPFHWQIEFPEVFERDQPGFDTLVGNPPFMGGSKISSSMPAHYVEYLADCYPESRGKSDLVAFFFRRAFELLRNCGALGLIATNTIREGSTRFTGLRWISAQGGQIFSAARRLRWPGNAAVVVSVVHVMKGGTASKLLLDGQNVTDITAYLLSFGPDEDPARLSANSNRAYSGVNPNGKGFVLTAQERSTLVEQEPQSAERIFPYLGSVEMNETIGAGASRYIIMFDDCDEDTVRGYPALYSHLHDTVRVQRMGSKEKRLRECWWQLSRPAGELRSALRTVSRVLVSGRHATHHTFAFQPTSTVFSDAVTVFLFDDYAAFAILQSQVHEVWAGCQGSSLKDDPRYIPEDCFETFAFPEHRSMQAALENAGRVYYTLRDSLMVQRGEGLTKTYNAVHDPAVNNAEIARFRDTYRAMDRVVLDAYGWNDIASEYEFVPDFVEEDDDNPNGVAKAVRYRWSDDVRDEVLARLLTLNVKRAQQERLVGSSAEPTPKARRYTRKKGAGPTSSFFSD